MKASDWLACAANHNSLTACQLFRLQFLNNNLHEFTTNLADMPKQESKPKPMVFWIHRRVLRNFLTHDRMI